MRGHIRKRGRGFVVVVDVGRDEAGRRRQKWHSGYKTKREACAALTEILGRMQTCTYVEPSKQTVASFMREWLATMQATLKPSTFVSYQGIVDSYIIPRIGQIPLQALTPAAINHLYSDLLLNGRRGRPGGLAPRTVRQTHMVLRKALADGVRWGRLPRNVADLADPPSPKSESGAGMKTWTAEELRQFLKSVESDRLYPAFLLAATTGMRRGEVLGLRWRDVDLDAGRLEVTQTLLAVRYQMYFSTPKSRRGSRSIALDATTVSALRTHRKAQLEERLRWGPLYQDSGLVFCREDGSPIHPDRFSDLFAERVKAAGLPRIRLHDLRHTHATLALRAGIHPKVVSERLGHATIAITLDTYSHAIPALEEEAAARIAEVVFGT